MGRLARPLRAGGIGESGPARLPNGSTKVGRMRRARKATTPGGFPPRGASSTMALLNTWSYAPIPSMEGRLPEDQPLSPL